MSRERLERAIKRNVDEVMAKDHGEILERGKFAVEVKKVKSGDSNFNYPNYGNKETCPKYYARWKIEPNTFCVINGVTSPVANIIKYIMRHDMKDGLKDLYKARDYLNMMIEHHYGKENV